MPAIDLTDEQAVELFRQLPAERRLSVLRTLAHLAAGGQEEQMAYAQDRVRKLCRQRGLDWERMGEDEREAFLDDIVHEDRKCGG